MFDLNIIKVLLASGLQAVTDPENQPHQWTDDPDGLEEAMGLFALLAEVESLRTELAVARQTGNDACDILLERHAEEERRLRAALPDANLLVICGTALGTMAGLYYEGALRDTFVAQAQALLNASARIREVQEVRGE